MKNKELELALIIILFIAVFIMGIWFGYQIHSIKVENSNINNERPGQVQI